MVEMYLFPFCFLNKWLWTSHLVLCFSPKPKGAFILPKLHEKTFGLPGRQLSPATVSRLSLLLWQKPWQSKAKTRQVRKKVKIKDNDTAFFLWIMAELYLSMIKWAIEMTIFLLNDELMSNKMGVEHQPSGHAWCWVSSLKKMLSEHVFWL